jgi:tetratricopeptide (TPR) repeat protein
MFSLLRSTLVAAILFFPLQLTVPGQDTQAPERDADLAAADQLFRAGKFAEAEASYQALLKNDPKLVPAQVGLIRAMLGQQKIDEALDAVNAALAAQPNSAALLAAKGDVQFRRGETSDAETSYDAAMELDPLEVRAHIGLMRLYGSYSMYRLAYDQLKRAHEIAPDDFVVQMNWLRLLPRKDQLAALESYLDTPHPGYEKETKRMAQDLEFLKATVDNSVHACRLVSRVEQTETKLVSIIRPISGSARETGVSLSTRVNDHTVLLQLDTGASGITVARKLAKATGLTFLSAEHLSGIGDEGEKSGYRAIADHIHMGDLEFQDCVVHVVDMPGLGDGLIGTNVFGRYVVDIDLPGKLLKLSPLPKRPEDAVALTSLNSDGEEQVNAEQKESSLTEQTPNEPKPSAIDPEAARSLPRNRYIAPEMANWTKVFRFGHLMLVPTVVGDSKPMLFLLDTGFFTSILSLRAGREVSKVYSENRIGIGGLNGRVKRIYTSKEATLHFGHLQQKANGILTLDLSTQSRQAGTEVSGILGFETLGHLEVKLDYRDGLVDFEYDPERQKR